MKFPSLVRPRFCKTPVSVTLYGEGLSEDGAPLVVCVGEFKCNYQDKAKTVLSAQKKTVECSGVILINGDIAPNSSTISGGYVVINGVKRNIALGTKARNPDGTVNFTQLCVV